MADWVTCPVCHLKHTARPDGVCPRCRTNLSAPAPQAQPSAAARTEPERPVAAPPPPQPPPAIVPGGSIPALVPPTPPVRPAPERVVTAAPPLGVAGDLVYPHERPLFTISLAISILAWLLLLVGTFGLALAYAPFVFLFYVFTQSALIAYIKGTAIKITPRQFPDLHARLTACCERLGLARVPDCYLLNGQGGFNAFATRFLGRSFVVLFSDLIDALDDRPGAVNFYLGHELGHIHRQHLIWGPVLMPGNLLPLLGAAYHRACESTCDRYGAACCAEAQDAVAGITALAAGQKRWKDLTLDEYSAQAQESSGFWMSFHELVGDYPWLVKRVARVVAFRDGRAPGLPSRNPLAYFFALFIPRTMAGGGGGPLGLLVVVAIIGIIAAIAIPSLLRARISANESAAIGDVRLVIQVQNGFVGQHGRAATLECLTGQENCPSLLSADFATAPVRHGYRFTPHLGSGSSFAYEATPAAPGQSGIRSFCGDTSGIIYASSSADPSISAGVCSQGWQPLF